MIKKASEKPVIWVGLVVSSINSSSLSKLEEHNKHFIIFLATMQKTVKVVVGETLERPPLNRCGRYYKLNLPKDITIDTNQYNLVNLNLLKQQQLEITGKFLLTDSRYKEVIIKLIDKTQSFSFKFPKNTEIARLYFFTSPGEKLIHYTNLRNKIWQIIFLLQKLDFQQNQR